jgi:hypothetical protein
MQNWFGFYAVTGGAAATLLGLLFVAVSLNAAQILGAGRESPRRLAEQAFQNYSTVIVVSLLALFPDLTPTHFGLAVIGVTTASGVWVLVRLYFTVTTSKGGARRYFLRRQLGSLIGFALLLFSSATMLLSRGDD